MQIFGNEEFLSILVTEALDACRRIEHVPMKGDFALDLAHFNSGHFTDIAPGFKFWDKTGKLLVVMRAFAKSALKAIKGTQAVQFLQSSLCFPREHGFIADVLVNLLVNFLYG